MNLIPQLQSFKSLQIVKTLPIVTESGLFVFHIAVNHGGSCFNITPLQPTCQTV
ncbi:hypothetical protein YC2023_091911 [Brassica napus]